MLSLTIPRSVRVRNIKLQLVYNFCVICILGYSIFSFIEGRNYEIQIANSARLVVSVPDSDDHAAVNLSEHILCSKSGTSDKGTDNQSKLEYHKEERCVGMCMHGLIRTTPEPCMLSTDLHIFDGATSIWSKLRSEVQLVAASNTPAEGGTCEDPDPSMPGVADYECVYPQQQKANVSHLACVDPVSCKSNCCELLPDMCDETIDPIFPTSYRGCQYQSVTGHECQKWSSQSPNTHNWHPSTYAHLGIGDHNFCRNTGEIKPWCYLRSGFIWDYCDPIQVIGNPTCGGSASGARCKFPFWHDDKEYMNCTLEGKNEPWCYTIEPNKWGYCNCSESVGHGWNSEAASLPWAVSSSSLILAFMDVQSFIFNYRLRLSDSDIPFGLWLNSEGRLPREQSEKDCFTILADSTGFPMQHFLPGDEIRISAPTLLSAAEAEPGPHGKHSLPPWVFEQGASIQVTLACYVRLYDLETNINSEYDWTQLIGDTVKETTPACVLQVEIEERMSSRITHSDAQVGKTTSARSYGLLLRTKGSLNSYHRAFDVGQLLIFTTSTLVLLSLPMKGLKFIITHWLGHLSKVYESVIEKDFHEVDECVRSVMQALVCEASFSQLTTGTQDAMVSKERVLEIISNAMRSMTEVDSTGRDVIVEFVFHHLSLKAGSRSLTREVFSEMRLSNVEEDIAATSFDVEQFHSLMGHDSMPLDVVAKLFDKGRKRQILERIFLPRVLSSLTSAKPVQKEGYPQQGCKQDKLPKAAIEEAVFCHVKKLIDEIRQEVKADIQAEQDRFRLDCDAHLDRLICKLDRVMQSPPRREADQSTMDVLHVHSRLLAVETEIKSMKESSRAERQHVKDDRAADLPETGGRQEVKDMLHLHATRLLSIEAEIKAIKELPYAENQGAKGDPTASPPASMRQSLPLVEDSGVVLWHNIEKRFSELERRLLENTSLVEAIANSGDLTLFPKQGNTPLASLMEHRTSEIDLRTGISKFQFKETTDDEKRWAAIALHVRLADVFFKRLTRLEEQHSHLRDQFGAIDWVLEHTRAHEN